MHLNLSADDVRAHQDLGTAYKEMGLFDQAMAEFSILEGEPSRAVFALMMTAECLEASGRLSEADRKSTRLNSSHT